MSLSSESNLMDLQAIKALKNAKVAIVKTDWNSHWVSLQTQGAHRIAEALEAEIIAEETVPGSVELPFGIQQLYHSFEGQSNAPEAIIAFGLVIRGGTPHFEYVCKMVTEGIGHLNLSLPIPVIFGVLTLDTEKQAEERLGGSHGHKGEEAMVTALKMIEFNRRMQNKKGQ